MNVALIPVRGGSKSIPFKNIKRINGEPLIYWTAKAACECDCIDEVYISTDSSKIRQTVESFRSRSEYFNKMKVIGRSEESASDTASTEMVMLEFANKYNFDTIVLIQATSPMLKKEDLKQGFKEYSRENTDAVLSVVRQKRFHWAYGDDGFCYATNYDIFHRPRRQEFDGYLVENGAFYITSKVRLLNTKNRLSGNIRCVEMNEDSLFEIDEPGDWEMIEYIMKKQNPMYSPPLNIGEIKMFLTDCDGCLTDGGMYYSEFGDELKKFNTRDGAGFQLLQKQGILTGIVTGESVKLNQRRAEKLGLDILKIGVKDKVKVIKDLCAQYKISLDQVAYIGDDINDLEAIRIVGFGCCPVDAVWEVKNAADYIAMQEGGKGVVREISEIIVRNMEK